MMRLFRLSQIMVAVLLVIFVFHPGLSNGTDTHGDFEANRAKLISYMLKETLSRHHFSHKELDDQLSRDAFSLYLEQLDSQKRFLLRSDVAQLREYADRIDDEMKKGPIELPLVASEMLRQRSIEARETVRELLAKPLDFTVEEYLETDADKLDFSATAEELKERWRKSLKLQVINRYLGLLEDEKGEKEGQENQGGLSAERETELRATAREKVLKRYEDFFARILEETLQDHYDNYFNAVARAFDPHTTYLPPTQKEDFDISMSGSLEGIGATLREDDGYIKVVKIIPGSAAWRQGQLDSEDVILKVAEGSGEPVDITDTRIRDAVKLIRGKKGTEVRLTVKKPDGRRLVIPIVRDVVQIEETFVKWTLLGDQEQGPVGYIKIPSFYRDFQHASDGSGRNATEDVRKALVELKKRDIAGLVLDLRNNGGGALTDAVDISGLFIDYGPVVQVKDSRGRVQILPDRDRDVEYDGPLVVLVNKFSASASEILAGAMQDYGRAIIIGSAHTHGKGTVQTIVDFNRNIPFRNMDRYKPLGALKMTTQKFYRVSGDSTQFRGVIPDIVLPDRMEHFETGEQFLDFSLPWDTVKETSYRKWPELGKDLNRLRSSSLARVSSSEEFREIDEEAERARKNLEQTRQALHIDAIRQERQEEKEFLDDQGISPHGEEEEERDDSRKELTKAEKRQQLAEKLVEDPYVDEARALISDLRRLPETAAKPVGAVPTN